MSIRFQVLGAAGRDNALLVRVDTGQALHRLLFDCGEGCLAGVSRSEIQSIDHLFFSHLHIDHVAGFDSFFRCTYDRDARPNVVWGPPGTATILHHRFRGFWWNLLEGQPGTWRVRDVHADRLRSFRFETADAFAARHEEEPATFGGRLLVEPDFTVEAVHLDHLGPSLGYLVREKARINVAAGRLAASGLRPGPWIQQLKQVHDPASEVEIDGERHDLRQLREQLLTETPGQSIAYLTDFRLDDATRERLAAWLAGCDTVVCEAQYRHGDLELARRNFHATATQVARMARQAEASQLVLFHLSDRYQAEEWREMLAESRRIFPRTVFPEHWVA